MSASGEVNDQMISLFDKARSNNIKAATGDDGDGVIRVSRHSLIAMHHGAESISLQAKKIRALQSGAYVSPFKGRGMEFDEVRAYNPGDDVRTLDWRVTARTGKPHTKLFREERERAVLLWIDLRRPMLFATQGAYKAVRAAQAAALLGWSAIQNGDRLGGLIFSETDHVELRPRRGKRALLHLVQKLADDPAWTPESHEPSAIDILQQALLRLRRVAQPGCLIFMLSDFDGLDKQHTAHLASLARHSDLVMVSIHDPLEAELPPAGRYRVSDGQRILTVDTEPEDIRSHYQQRYRDRQAELHRQCQHHGIYQIELSTADDPLSVLRQGLGGLR